MPLLTSNEARPFDSKNAKKITGNAAVGLPFWPGGFDPIKIDEIVNQSQNEEIDWSKLRRDPPNMSGIDFGEDNKTKVVHIEDLIEKEMEDSAIEV